MLSNNITSALFILLVTFQTIQAVCQDHENDKKLKVKIAKVNLYYYHSFKDKENVNLYFYRSLKDTDFGNIAPEIEVGRSFKFTHGFELSKLSINKNDTKTTDDQGNIIGGAKIRRIDIGLKYQFNYYFFKNEETDFKPYIGSSVKYSFYDQTTDPYISTRFPMHFLSTGFLFGFVPGVKYFITDKLNLELSFPVDILFLGVLWQRVHNPNLSIIQQRNGGFDYGMKEFYKFNDLSISIGAGLKF
ncbi:MAG: hypothetical protein IIA88_04715 [Bacteroidetes bacterium]|nr:hypothetical protein [Bacteroidota bacterium]